MTQILQKIGGIAALGHAAALVMGMVLSFTLMFPLLDASPDQALKFLADNRTLVYLWNLIVDWGSAITLVIMLLALYDWLKAGSPTMMQMATVFGLIWAGLIVGTSSLMLHNFGVVANLNGNSPAQAAAWTALVRSLWVLVLSLAALRTGGLFRAPGQLGVFLGIVGILTMIPALAKIMFMIFGPGMMVWSAWVGIVMLDRSVVVSAPKAERSCRVTALDTGKSTGEQGNENEEFTEEGRHCRTDRLSDTTCLAVERLPNQDKH